MKNRNTSLLAAVFTAASLLMSCVVLSVYPFYTEKDVVFDATLLGSWTPKDNDKETWQFEKGRDKAYKFTWTNNKPMVFEGHLFKLKGQAFIDFFAINSEVETIPPHYLMKVVQGPPTLRLATLNEDWLKKLLKRQPKLARHTTIKTDPEHSEDYRIVLTAETAELQRFITRHLNADEAWETPTDFERKK